MKFENDYFKIEITKKKLTKEQKQEKRKKLVKRIPIFAAIIALVVCLAVVINKKSNNHPDDKISTYTDSAKITEADNQLVKDVDKTDQTTSQEADTTEEFVDENATYISVTELAAASKEKYASKRPYDYGKPIDDISRGDKIKVKVGYDVDELPIEYWREIYELYKDPMLTERYPINYEWDKDSSEVIISPYSYPVNLVSTYEVDTGVLGKYPHSETCFFDKGSGNDWGNLRNLYLACYYDEETGEKLDKPVVRIVTVKGELEDNPVLHYTVTPDGRLNLRWSRVEGASIYMICEAVEEAQGFGSTMHPIAYTDGVNWSTELPTMQSQFMNVDMKYYDFGEEDWIDSLATDELLESFKKDYPEEYEAKGVINYKRSYKGKFLCVVAMSDKGTSMASNMIDYSLLSSNLPYCVSGAVERENGFKTSCKAITEIPIYDYIVMCDGRVYNKLIDYKTEEATVTKEHFYSFTDDGEVDGREDLLRLNLPYTVEGTAFSGVVTVDYYDEAKFESDLKDIEEREALIRMKGGSVAPEPVSEPDISGSDVAPSKDQVAVNDENQVFATNALSEYIAINLLSGNPRIDLGEFNEAKDFALLKDAFLEAYYQNPLIFGIEKYIISSDCDYIVIGYDHPAMEQASMQAVVREKVAAVTKDIIKDGMSDEEKEIAINEYLCSTVEYDFDALSAAAENDYKYVSDEYKNAFNAYGALIDGKCVCQGYSEAFKLLADAAGLECIVVTGMLEGETPHAWNKVNINGEWCVIDTTNNDSEFIVNALFNIPESVSGKVLVESPDYVLDDYLVDYMIDSEEYEFYHITNNYYDISKVTDEIIDKVNKSDGKKVIIRTDYDMTDDDFSLICSMLVDAFGEDTKLQGCHWLGVICIFSTPT